MTSPVDLQLTELSVTLRVRRFKSCWCRSFYYLGESKIIINVPKSLEVGLVNFKVRESFNVDRYDT